ARWIELGPDELRQQEPALDRRYQFGVFLEGVGHCTDPGAYVAALAAHAQALGARRVQGRAAGFRIEGGRLRAVTLEGGGEVACAASVIAAGARARALAAAAGDRVSLETERGYHAVVAEPGFELRHFVMSSDGKMGLSSMRGGLRAAGQVELAGLAAAPNWKRAEVLRDHLLRTFPALPRNLPAERVKVWMGHRPSTPDGRPVIGRAAGCADVVHAYGHGHIGLISGPMTGRLVADLVSGRTPTIDPAPYAPQRFH
ncbi:MAG TPA: FAD-binding oxidoreductase, partial [Acetobacteraceae bacterium]|nr:FAD-binding oxidoreductase [Acetobacteraceae bacterium]